MEQITVILDAERFDKAVHGGLELSPDLPVLPECGDLAFYVKPNATVGGKPMVVVTFTVKLPDGKFARAQATNTFANYELMANIMHGWKMGGHLDK